MKSKEEIHEEFLTDFKALLLKHDAEFNLDFVPDGWDSRDVPTIIFNSQWINNEHIREYSELRLPSYEDGKD